MKRFPKSSSPRFMPARGQAEKQTLDQLVGAYTAAMTAKGTYDKVQAAFAAAEQSLPTLCDKLKELAQALQMMAQTADGSPGPSFPLCLDL